MKMRVLIHPAEEASFWAEAPGFPGPVSEGETSDEVLVNVREAATGWLEVAAERFAVDEVTRIAEVER